MAQQLPVDELSIVIARIQGLLLTEEKVSTRGMAGTPAPGGRNANGI
jgi:hypothetical protein